jgi:ATP adenylyltransferase
MGELNLAAAIARATERANAAGALVPISAERTVVREGGVDFEVKWISTLAMKDRAGLVPRVGDKAAPGFNPFLPYEEALFVADASPTHVILLNKFPITPGHVVIVTRAFAEQLAPLDRDDFAAAALVLRGLDGILFFNGGPVGGASQRHKHLQLTPMAAPIEKLLPARPVGEPQALPMLPFQHAFASVTEELLSAPERLLALFERACARCGVRVVAGEMTPYNLLLTRRWLMVVPRSRECWEADGARISINAMGFAGSVVLRHAEQIDAVRRAGVMNVLASVT